VSAQFERPPWSQRPAADVIAPLVLVGSWRSVDPAGEPSSTDRAIVARVANTDYDFLERDLDEWANLGDPPVRRSGRGWRLAAPIDAWTLLRRTLSAPDLSRWSAAAIEVLTEVDPVLDVPSAERPLAGVRGISRSWSDRLRRGLAQGAAILGAAGDGRVGDRRPAEDYANQVVHELLAQANADDSGRLWQSLSDVLPLLAEAAPDEFLDAVNQGLAASSPLLASMFGDATDPRGWGPSSAHTGLLWALETLCWSPRYLPGATDALAHLAEIDPGGRLSNRPPDSLRRVFLPWRPYTAAPPERRLTVLAGLSERRQAMAFQLLVSLLPAPGDTTHPTAAPRFRDWRPDTEAVTLIEHLQMITGVVDLVLRMLREEPSRWIGILDALCGLPRDQLDRFINALELVTPDALPDVVRRQLWNELTELTARHRQFHEARWAFPDELLRHFERIADRLEPSGDATRHARLFDWHPDLPGTDKRDHDAYDTALRRAQGAAVTEALAEGGLEPLLALATASKLARMVGAITAESGTEELGSQILQELEHEGPRREFAIGWAMRMAELHEEAWRADTAASFAAASEHARALFFFALPVDQQTWSLVDADTSGVQEQYWRSLRTMGISPDNVEALAERLLERRRPWAVVDLLTVHLYRTDDRPKPSPDLIQRALRAALEPNLSETLPPGSLDYALRVLLDHLAAAGTDSNVMFELEWAYLLLLKYTRQPHAIYERLAQDPDLFADIVCHAYRAKGDTRPRRADETAEAHILRCWSILQDWRRLPGTQKDESVDAAALSSWVQQSRTLLLERDRADIGDQCLGQLLSGSPVGADGAWPCEAVRSVIEATKSKHLDTGVEIGRFNARGVTSRGMFDGGQQEIALASQYWHWADIVGDRSPRTGRLLRRLADGYARDARREDESAERAGDEE
jgi:hypothetical protein